MRKTSQEEVHAKSYYLFPHHVEPISIWFGPVQHIAQNLCKNRTRTTRIDESITRLSLSWAGR